MGGAPVGGGTPRGGGWDGAPTGGGGLPPERKHVFESFENEISFTKILHNDIYILA